MKVLSLFSGVGGFDMGLENAGMETVFQCEWDKHANSILHKHWPEVPKWDDVSTLTGKHIHAVAYPIDTRNALRDPEKYDAQNRQGLGIGADGDPMATLTSAHVNAVAYDEYNDTTNEVHHALRAGTKQPTGVLEPTMAVRRLTPLECERLMGWPDDHTRWKDDGTEQADTHRYKQCGNGVASPVAQWIAKHILAI